MSCIGSPGAGTDLSLEPSPRGYALPPIHDAAEYGIPARLVAASAKANSFSLFLRFVPRLFMLAWELIEPCRSAGEASKLTLVLGTLPFIAVVIALKLQVPRVLSTTSAPPLGRQAPFSTIATEGSFGGARPWSPVP